MNRSRRITPDILFGPDLFTVTYPPGEFRFLIKTKNVPESQVQAKTRGLYSD